MINRELIRIKIVQLTYAYYQNGNKNMENAEKELLFSLSKAYDLYNFLLSLIVAVTREARKYIDVATAKAQREGGEMPSQKFSLNRFALQLEENKMLNDFIETKGLKWDEQEKLVQDLYLRITESETYQDYMKSEEDSYEADREFWRQAFKKLICGNEMIEEYLEDKSFYWNDDIEIVETFTLKTIKKFEEKRGSAQPLLPMFKDEDDKDFAIRLFRQSLLKGKEYRERIDKHIRNWESERVASMDLIIMQVALAEILSFPSIPISVTLNEYIDAAKYYSTPKSGNFINGILDSIVGELKKEKLLLKD